MKFSIKRRQLGILCFFILFSLYAAASLMFGVKEQSYYSIIYLLPVTYLVCIVLFAVVFREIDQNLGVLAIILLEFIRMVLTPLFMQNGNFSSPFKGVISQQDIEAGIGLMCYECFVLFIVLAVRVSKYSNVNQEKSEISIVPPSAFLKIAIYFMTAYILVISLLFPKVWLLYSNVLHFSDSDFTTVTHTVSSIAGNAIERALFTLFKMFLDIDRICLPMLIMLKFRNKYGERISGVLLCVLFSAAQLTLISSTTARSVIAALLLLYLTTKLYKRYTKLIYICGISGIIFLVVAYFLIRFNVGSRYGDNILEYSSNILNAYFSGLANVAAGFNLPDGKESATFWGALYSAIPFNSTLFGLTVEKLQPLYNEANNSYGQIQPMIVEGNYYFGMIFSPILSGFFANLSYKFGNISAKTSNAWEYMSALFISLMSAIAIGMYNEQILLVWFTDWLIPFYILAKFAHSNSKEIQKKRV